MRQGFTGWPSHTLLLVTPRLIARMDFAGRRSPRLVRAWSAPISHPAEFDSPASHVPRQLSTGSPLGLGSQAERAIQLGPERIGRVSVLSTQFYSDVVMLQADIAAMATPNELAQSLAIEAELDSQVSPFETQVTNLPLDSDTDQFRSYSVTLIANSQIKELQRVLASKKAPLYRLAHPLALSRSEELYNRQTVASGIDYWNEVAPPKDQLLEKEDHLDLENIAERFIHSLSTSSSPLWFTPTIEPSLRGQVSLAAIYSVAAALGCIGHYSYSGKQLEAQTQRYAKLSEIQSDYDAKSAELSQLQKQLVKVRADEKTAREAREVYQQRMQLAIRRKQLAVERWANLLSTLSTASQECWIRRIDSDNHATVLCGIALSLSQAHALAARLEVALRENGWHVSPATTNSTWQGLVEFSIVLLPSDTDSATEKPDRSIVFNVDSDSNRIHLVAVATRRPH